MRKVLVLGCAGSGKSTFSTRLGHLTGLSVIHLDSYYWKAGWIAATEEEWDQTIDELLNHDSYIMDGNYSRTLNKRLMDADVVFYFDFPRLLCIYRAIKRRIINHGRTREDMAAGCKEKIDLEFLRWIWNFRTRNRGKILEALDQVKEQTQVIIFRTTKEVKEYLAGMESTRGNACAGR
ncbi:DNA topology modulation protein [Paenibacillus sp. YSY-4.3]